MPSDADLADHGAIHRDRRLAPEHPGTDHLDGRDHPVRLDPDAADHGTRLAVRDLPDEAWARPDAERQASAEPDFDELAAGAAVREFQDAAAPQDEPAVDQPADGSAAAVHPRLGRREDAAVADHRAAERADLAACCHHPHPDRKDASPGAWPDAAAPPADEARQGSPDHGRHRPATADGARKEFAQAASRSEPDARQSPYRPAAQPEAAGQRDAPEQPEPQE